MYVRGNPVNWNDPSGLYSPKAIERSVSQDTLNILRSTRKGLYQLLQDAKDGDFVAALRIHLDVDPGSLREEGLHTGVLECKNERIVFVNHFDGSVLYDVDQFVQELDMAQKTEPHTTIAKWTQKSDSHYYHRAPFYPPTSAYYSDFEDELDSPLPDVVAREWSASLSYEGVNYGIGYLKLIDKFGRGYIVSRIGVGPALSPLPFAVEEMDGYVDPPSQANTREELKVRIRGFGSSGENDLSIAPPGTIIWYSRGTSDPFGFKLVNAGVGVQGPYDDWGQNWDYLDGDASDAIAVEPDNACNNCGGG
jgi:hypothetical protein